MEDILSLVDGYFTFDTFWVLLAIIPGFITYKFLKGKCDEKTRIFSSLLNTYVFLVFIYTVLSRNSGNKYQYQLELFWSYRKAVHDKTLLVEIILNYVLFMPIGFLMAELIKFRKIFLFSCVISTSIELLQLVTMSGLFEFDDIFGNTLGAVIGAILFYLLRGIFNFLTNRKTSKRKKDFSLISAIKGKDNKDDEVEHKTSSRRKNGPMGSYKRDHYHEDDYSLRYHQSDVHNYRYNANSRSQSHSHGHSHGHGHGGNHRRRSYSHGRY